jgi:CDP-diacylglycerol--glycerol-3-phosphate 3-phosphatidyltransferase
MCSPVHPVHLVQRRERKVVRASSALRLVAGITLARVPLACAFALVLILWSDGFAHLTVCLGLLALIEATDILDGFLARRLRVDSDLGAMLDPLADSISRLTVYWALAASGLVYLVVPLVMAARDITVGYCRLWRMREGRSVKARLSGKLKAVVQGVASVGILLQPLYENHLGEPGRWTAPVWSYLVIAATIVSGIDYVWDAFAQRRLATSEGARPVL